MRVYYCLGVRASLLNFSKGKVVNEMYRKSRKTPMMKTLNWTDIDIESKVGLKTEELGPH